MLLLNLYQYCLHIDCILHNSKLLRKFVVVSIAAGVLYRFETKIMILLNTSDKTALLEEKLLLCSVNRVTQIKEK